MTQETKHAGGRPPHYATPELLQAAVDQYFKKPTNHTVIQEATEDQEEKIIPYYTVSGFAYALGFMDRQSIYDYDKRSDEFSCIIKRARLFIESEYECLLQGKNVTGIIFALKNMGWRDMQEVHQVRELKVMGTITKDGKDIDFDIGEKVDTDASKDA